MCIVVQKLTLKPRALCGYFIIISWLALADIHMYVHVQYNTIFV